MALPSPRDSQAYCDVSALEAGQIYLPDEMFITGAAPGKVTIAPSLSFLLRHATNNKTLVFDLGIRKDWQNYPPSIVHWINTVYRVHVGQDALESLVNGGVSLEDVDYVCISHCHWDHTGDTTAFKKSTFLVGGACQALVKPGYPIDPNGRFASDLLPEGRTIFFDTNDWKPIGPFPRALDFFEDGSLYIIDAPGHLPGHINILARSSRDGGWIYLAGDSAHHWNLITLESTIALGHPGHLHECAHTDKDAAEAHIHRINELTKIPRHFGLEKYPLCSILGPIYQF
ncbi:hypothetical protein HYPSUDRAFT_290261 [Hypholoma sublateritium FD-334 SS-4]|uniref:Metallo-beta-lactamase domain-containing protein n=1 Tax=Hypholoma sublateritium (strain FD-334 SS-4) TaxID=945553 RepID=A0A0D2KPC5_HYPSF|nr:hypothetical protein HYPSUDRAFT_290261 [Hypholoma sublateritium FD-334 SS-4]